MTPTDQTQRERLARIETPEPIEWRTSNGTIPIFRCGLCDRPTPMLVDGLGFDCCAPATEQYFENIGMETSADESGTWSLTTGQFLLASIVVCMGAIAWVL